MSTLCSNRLDEALFESYGRLINPAYPQFLKRLGLNRIAVKAEGATVTDSAGKSYIDCIGGYGLFNLGHNHPGVIQELKEQLDKKDLFTRPLITEVQVRLAEKLAEITPESLTYSFVCNSGSEAIDNAIKLARLHTGKKEIISTIDSFHGYTFGALSASGVPRLKKLFEPMVPGIIHVPFGDIHALENTISSETAAILLEPIQHDAGVIFPPEDYLSQVRALCDEKDVILILDEIITGCGKTGFMFAFERSGAVPDILVIGKSLGGGVFPIGAMIAKKKLWRKFGLSFPMSASSFAGNSLASRVALTTIRILQQETLIDDCQKKGEILLNKLKNCLKKYPAILKRVEGRGLMIGVETVQPQKTVKLIKEMSEQQVLAASAFGNSSVVMLEPPLVINFDQIQKVADAFESACNTLTQE
ncbi:MAG: aspartate aminotransferase family protein [bacterium]|nr:aspartate aminotransferase family protein [bacterium]